MAVLTAPKCGCKPARPKSKRTVQRGTRPRTGRAPPVGSSVYPRLLPVDLIGHGMYPRVEGDLDYDPENGFNYGIYMTDIRRDSCKVAKIIAEEPVYLDGSEGPLTFAAWKAIVAAPNLDREDVIAAAVRAGNDTEPNGVNYVFDRHGIRVIDASESVADRIEDIVNWAKRA